MAYYTLCKPIRDNKTYFKYKFPGAVYSGDIGDSSHQARPSDHNPSPDSTMWWVRAQDFGDGGGFQLPRFGPWLINSLKAGKYPEVQYVITRHPQNSGGPYYGLFDRRYGWRQQTSSGHDHHIHISYRRGYENYTSRIIADWHDHLRGVTLQSATTTRKGLPEMLRLEVPAKFAFAEDGSLLDGDAIVGATFEWTDASGSVPSFGPGVMAVGGSHGNSPPVKLWVEFNTPDGRKRQPDMWVGKGHDEQWPKLPKGCFGVSVGRIKAEGSDETTPTSITLVWGAK